METAYQSGLRSAYQKLRSKNPDAPAEFERIVQACYELALNTGDSAIDCGAHSGKHTLPMMQKVGPSGRVYAFEPLPSQFALLVARAEALEDAAELIAHNVAVFSSNKELVTFYEVPERPGISGLSLRHSEHSSLEVSVEQLTLDSLGELRRDGNIKFIKTDVEGAELDALIGAEEIIRENRPVIHLECGMPSLDAFEVTPNQVYAYLNGLDYGLFDLLGNALLTAEDFNFSVRTDGVYDYLAIPKEHSQIEEMVTLLKNWPFDW